MKQLSELLLSGPGHEGYSYNADVYCVDCGQEIIRELYEKNPSVFDFYMDTEKCAECHEYMYGPQEEDNKPEEE